MENGESKIENRESRIENRVTTRVAPTTNTARVEAMSRSRHPGGSFQHGRCELQGHAPSFLQARIGQAQDLLGARATGLHLDFG